jgi:hypothetical protein
MISLLFASKLKVYCSSGSPLSFEARRIERQMLQRLKKMGAFFLIFLGFFALQAQDYETAFRKALEEEAAQNWSAAIQFYLEASRADPSKTFPEGRIKSIFGELLRRGENTQSLRIILPIELDQRFEREGVYSLDGAPPVEESPWIGYVIWTLVGLGLLIGLIFLGFSLYHQRAASLPQVKPPPRRAPVRSEAVKVKSAVATPRPAPAIRASVQTSKASPPSAGAPTGSIPKPTSAATTAPSSIAPPKMTGPANLPPGFAKPKPAAMTEKSREEIKDIMSSVSSLTQQLKRPESIEPEPSEEEIVELKESNIVQALAETLITEVKVDETDQGRFSKMTLDASLFFGESDVDFFEKEFGDQSSKNNGGEFS